MYTPAYIPKNFQLQELVSPNIFNTLQENAWMLLDPELLQTLDNLREFFGYPMVINDWKNGGQFKERGYREPSAGVGKCHGAHYVGKAADIDFYEGNQLIPAQHMRKMILYNKEQFPYIAGCEKGVGWCHIDGLQRNGYQPGMICLFDAQGGFSWI